MFCWISGRLTEVVAHGGLTTGMLYREAITLTAA